MFLELCSQKLFHQTARPILHNGHKTQEIYQTQEMFLKQKILPKTRNKCNTRYIPKQEINVTQERNQTQETTLKNVPRTRNTPENTRKLPDPISKKVPETKNTDTKHKKCTRLNKRHQTEHQKRPDSRNPPNKTFILTADLLPLR